jgi:putative molybdopterin biosynthesis protein
LKTTIANNISALRASRKLSVVELASAIGVTRQTVYAMEAGNYVPNTAVALKLARELEVRVEDLFSLGENLPSNEQPVKLLPGFDGWQAQQPVQLCKVGKTVVAVPAYPVQWSLPAVDAVLAAQPIDNSGAKATICGTPHNFGNRILMAGCDPGISILQRHMELAGSGLVIAPRNSSEALRLLRDGCIHIAGTHLRDEATGESNLPAIGRMFPKNSVAVISFALWEEGILTRAGNPKGIREIADIARKGMRFVNREAGSGSRILFDSRIRAAGIPSTKIRGYGSVVLGHLAAAWQVHSGAADCCIATSTAARAFGLGFMPLVTERYDLAVRRKDLSLPGVQLLFETLNHSTFRRELESAGGYDTNVAGRRVL